MRKNIKYTGILALTTYIINNLQTNTRRVSNTVFKNNNKDITITGSTTAVAASNNSLNPVNSGSIKINRGQSIALTVYSDCAYKELKGWNELGSWLIVGKEIKDTSEGTIEAGNVNYFSSDAGYLQLSFKPGETDYGTFVISSLLSPRVNKSLVKSLIQADLGSIQESDIPRDIRTIFIQVVTLMLNQVPSPELLIQMYTNYLASVLSAGTENSVEIDNAVKEFSTRYILTTKEFKQIYPTNLTPEETRNKAFKNMFPWLTDQEQLTLEQNITASARDWTFYYEIMNWINFIDEVYDEGGADKVKSYVNDLARGPFYRAVGKLFPAVARATEAEEWFDRFNGKFYKESIGTANVFTRTAVLATTKESIFLYNIYARLGESLVIAYPNDDVNDSELAWKLPYIYRISVSEDSVKEGGSITFTVTRSTIEDVDQLFTFSVVGTETANGTDVAVANSDDIEWVGPSLETKDRMVGTYIIKAGESTATFTIKASNDQMDEGDEGIKVSFYHYDQTDIEIAHPIKILILDKERTKFGYELTVTVPDIITTKYDIILDKT